MYVIYLYVCELNNISLARCYKFPIFACTKIIFTVQHEVTGYKLI